MYNQRMPITFVEIRICNSCGLRYPLPITGKSPAKRCPFCMGETRIILSQSLISEPKHFLPEASSRKRAYSVLLDNVRSTWNVGSILRCADGFGYTHAYMCGITSTPDNEAVKKTSLGAEKSVRWTSHKDAVTLTKDLKSKGTRIIGLEEHEKSNPLIGRLVSDNISPTVLIVGNEIAGVDPHLLDLCDEIYHIPMYGEKKSFNVAAAFGIAAYALG